MPTDGARPAVILGPVDTTGDGQIDALDTTGDGAIDADLERRDGGAVVAVPRRNTVVPRFLASQGRVSTYRSLIRSEREAAAHVALDELRAVVHADEALHRRLSQRRASAHGDDAARPPPSPVSYTHLTLPTKA